jgi:putative transcriptional regulator
MNEDTITRFDLDPQHVPTLTPAQRVRLEAMTEEDIHAAALADPDNPPLTEEECARLERVPNVEAIREKLRLSQREFADMFGLSLAVVRDWEQRRCIPDQVARTLLTVIERNPEAVRQALRKRA